VVSVEELPDPRVGPALGAQMGDGFVAGADDMPVAIGGSNVADREPMPAGYLNQLFTRPLVRRLENAMFGGYF
jgi:hypothetical protein